MGKATIVSWDKFADEQANDEMFWKDVYDSMDTVGGETVFPPGMDEYSLPSMPVFIRIGSASYPCPTIPALLQKVVLAYRKTLSKRWDESE